MEERFYIKKEVTLWDVYAGVTASARLVLDNYMGTEKTRNKVVEVLAEYFHISYENDAMPDMDELDDYIVNELEFRYNEMHGYPDAE